MPDKDNIFDIPSEPFETLSNHGLIEPEVWIEYQRANLANDAFWRRSFADAIHRNNVMPDGTVVRTYEDKKTNETVWEYLC